MFLGQFEPAIKAAQELIDTTPEALLRVPSPPMADFIEGYLPMKQHVLVRFGKWREIIAQELPKDRDLYCSHHGDDALRQGPGPFGAGRNRRGREDADGVPRGQGARARLRAACTTTPSSTCWRSPSEMLDGELEYRRGNFDVAFAHLRRSVELEDALPYDEPWGWMQPTRHALGALLLEQGHLAEAEAVYRADLGFDPTISRSCWHPDNVWSLHGLHECLTRRGDTLEAPLIKARLDLAQARADVPVRASCLCRRQAASADPTGDPPAGPST